MFGLSFCCIYTVLTSRHHQCVVFQTLHFTKQLVLLIRSFEKLSFSHHYVCV